MISNYALAKTPISRMLMALLLAVQLLCVVSSVFAVEHSGDDIHHQTLWSDTTEVVAEQSTVTDAPFHAGCDHCSHCHAAHIGLFKTAAALPVIGNELAVSYLNHSPSSPKRSIYRPPIA